MSSWRSSSSRSRRGGRRAKLSFGLLSYENEIKKAAEALSEGGTALQAVETQVRTLQQTVDAGLEGARGALENVIGLAQALPEEGVELAAQARAQLAALPSAAADPDRARSDFSQAMARFDQLVSQLESVRSQRAHG
jgi:DNA repair ATPase RecN